MAPLKNNTSKLFSLMYERDSCILWFVNELHLIYQRLTGFMTSFDFIPIVIMSWGRFSLCHSYQTSFGFLGLDLNLDWGLHDHMITRFASLSISLMSYYVIILTWKDLDRLVLVCWKILSLISKISFSLV